MVLPYFPVAWQRGAWYAAALFWLLACAAGLGWLMHYQNVPGEAAQVPQRWPHQSKIERDPRGATLVMFVHPHCPCSRASLDELERIVAQSGGKLAPRIVFFRPPGVDPGWQETGLWRTARAVPGAQLSADENGDEAKRFGATTSGHTVVYDGEGVLLFSGGITLARGHCGDSPGHDAVVAVARRSSTSTSASAGACCRTPVFGCPLSEATRNVERR